MSAPENTAVSTETSEIPTRRGRRARNMPAVDGSKRPAGKGGRRRAARGATSEIPLVFRQAVQPPAADVPRPRRTSAPDVVETEASAELAEKDPAKQQSSMGTETLVKPVTGEHAQAEAATTVGAGTSTATAAGDESETDVRTSEFGEIPADQAPDPVPAPRFEGNVLQTRARILGENPLFWITWGVIILLLVVLIVLLLTGVIGGSKSAETAAVELEAFKYLFSYIS